MKKVLQQQAVGTKTKSLITPESPLEEKLLGQPEFQNGLNWGEPRYGHPEGKVVYHIQEVLDNVDTIAKSESQRAQLRIITLVHDTFKYLEDKKRQPRDWSKHHGVYARRFLEKYTDNESLLDIVELHDEAYYIWRLDQLKNDKIQAQDRLNKLFGRIKSAMPLYYAFFVCDTQTGDKNQAPLDWFTNIISESSY